MVMKVMIFGDSFSSDRCPDSWIDLLANEHEVVNHSSRGISEFRIYRNLLDNKKEIKTADAVIVFHTNPDRVYVPDWNRMPTRHLPGHPMCDMVASDITEKWPPAEIYYKNFYDQYFQETIYNLIVDDIRQQCKHTKLLEFSGFDLGSAQIHSIHQLRKQHAGNINHLDIIGNIDVFSLIRNRL
jgi:hypothetical protein